MKPFSFRRTLAKSLFDLAILYLYYISKDLFLCSSTLKSYSGKLACGESLEDHLDQVDRSCASRPFDTGALNPLRLLQIKSQRSLFSI